MNKLDEIRERHNARSLIYDYDLSNFAAQAVSDRGWLLEQIDAMLQAIKGLAIVETSSLVNRERVILGWEAACDAVSKLSIATAEWENGELT